MPCKPRQTTSPKLPDTEGRLSVAESTVEIAKLKTFPEIIRKLKKYSSSTQKKAIDRLLTQMEKRFETDNLYDDTVLDEIIATGQQVKALLKQKSPAIRSNANYENSDPDKLPELLKFLPQIEKDFDTWDIILTGRVKSLPSKRRVMDFIKVLPPEILQKIAEMKSPRLIAKVPEPLSDTIKNIDENCYLGIPVIKNFSRSDTNTAFWGNIPTRLEYEIADGFSNPPVDPTITGTIGEKMNQYESKFNAGNRGSVTTLGIYGYLALWRLFQEEKKNNPDLPIMDQEADTYFNRNHLIKTATVASGNWGINGLVLANNNPIGGGAMCCRSAVVVFRQP